MQRRHFSALVATTAMLGVRSVGAADVSEGDAASGIRVALERGAVAAVGLLGRPDGFLANPKVRIPLGLLERCGQGAPLHRPAAARR
jgi:hypothetical protein